MNYGNETGEVCNREGCTGIIAEHEKERSCSCHINPPCSACVDDRHYCPECDWSGLDEQHAYPVQTNHEPYKVKTVADLDSSKIDWIAKSHTHFSMIKEGVYPEGMTREEVREKVKGTFGGRFTHFKGGRFIYIAYTD